MPQHCRRVQYVQSTLLNGFSYLCTRVSLSSSFNDAVLYWHSYPRYRGMHTYTSSASLLTVRRRFLSLSLLSRRFLSCERFLDASSSLFGKYLMPLDPHEPASYASTGDISFVH